jgi:hypothetical protein
MINNKNSFIKRINERGECICILELENFFTKGTVYNYYISELSAEREVCFIHLDGNKSEHITAECFNKYFIFKDCYRNSVINDILK